MPFVTWLVGTAYLHTAMIQEKRGMFKNWSVLLMAVTFGSMFFGTSFIRSGLLTSVHAFAQSNLAPLFFGFMLFMLIATAALWITRLDALKSDNKLDAAFSREGIFLLQNVLFVSSAFTVFVGTIFPVLSEAIGGVKITVGPPFYNQAVGPQMLLLVFLMGVAPLLAWRKANGTSVLRQSIIGIGAAVITLVALVALVGVSEPVALLGFALCAYTLAQQLSEYARGVNARVKNLGESVPQALARLFQKNQRRYGGYFIHIGVILLAIGAIGKGFYGTDVIRAASVNESFTHGGYTFTYRGIEAVDCEFDDCQSVQARVLVQRADGSVVSGLYPRKDSFPRTGQSSTIADTTGTFNQEVYVILAGWENNGETASFQIYINPLINWIWVGGVVMILGFFAAFWPHEETAPKPSRAPSTKPAGAKA
jgi:cytochrome c-type biogenesis protein CcmF